MSVFSRLAGRHARGFSAGTLPCLVLYYTRALSGADSRNLGSLCTLQDEAFASRFDLGAIVFGMGLAFFALPLLASLLPPGWYTRAWWPTRFLLRYVVIGGSVSILVVLLFLGLPYLGIFNPELAVPAVAAYYPSVQPDYLIACRDVAVTSPGILFGLLGSDRNPAVFQPLVLVGALLLGAGVWLALFWVVVRVLRARLGIASGR